MLYRAAASGGRIRCASGGIFSDASSLAPRRLKGHTLAHSRVIAPAAFSG